MTNVVSLRRGDSIMIREIGEEIVVLDVESNQVHQLNPTASFIWRQCGQGLGSDDIAARLAEAFDIDVETARRDTQALLASLASLGLLEL